MSVPSKPLPTLGQDNQTEDPKIREVLQELQQILTGGVDDSNLTPARRGSYQTIAATTFQLPSNISGTWMSDMQGAAIQSGGGGSIFAPKLIAFDPADFALPGATTNLRLRTMVHIPTAGAPGVNFTMGLHPLSTLTFSGGQYSVTLGAAVGSVTRNTPAGNSQNFDLSTEFGAPAQDAYAFAVAPSGVTATQAVVTMMLQMRHV